ncbi:LON peptidase substrate-binding domain-containing protein [Polyangium sp. 6x1]|uniref:LON peptidase substrate-binding domain-containing protein n=1 Tax=Polyangium sp. 6x1 TaxID=3042689 RepID=UPI0024824AF9|nr:LON peptidase substrate-binding domain-containing protein [Polyangium sp. 6x1]MDI1443705.1 LON peptidase substrate-binding domain-containing protein [Polyangium sp. 6x1]
MNTLSDLLEALPALPLFPLPNAVLFPGALLPLHIFEPRYRAMVADVLKTHRSMAIVMITNERAVDAHGHPEIAEVAGLGTILDHTELPGGRYNILLRGRVRVRLSELPFEPPYRRAAAEVLVPPDEDVTQSELSALVSTATAFAQFVRERERGFEFRLPRDAKPALLADLCAHHLVLDARERQAILETLSPRARVRRVAEVLAMQRHALGPGGRDLN